MRELVSTSLLLSKILTFIFLSLCCYFSKSCTSVALSVWLDLYSLSDPLQEERSGEKEDERVLKIIVKRI
jgi:hypothetical protein